MRDSTNQDESTRPPISPPREDDLRSIMLGRPAREHVDVGSGEFSAEAKSDAEPVWTDVASDEPTVDENPWQETERYGVEPQREREDESPPFYGEASPEVDDRHPSALSRLGPPAGFGRRLIAYLVDNAVTIVILSLLFPMLLGRPYIDYEGIMAEIEAAGDQVAALPTATPVLGSADAPAQNGNVGSPASDTQSWTDVFAGLFLALAVTTVYNTILVGMWGTTVGKRLMNVYVLDGNGNIPGIPLAFARALATIVSTAIFYVGYLFVLRTDHRALHDLLVGTYAITLTSVEKPAPRGDQQID